jgi:glutamine amidotransferase
MVTIVDYGVGNLASIQNMLRKVGVQSVISTDFAMIEEASKIVLPGVGHFDNCMKMFNASGLREIVTKKIMQEKIPVLGICVGCQMLLEGSEEGIEKGLGWVKGSVIKFNMEKLPAGLKIPHMGWTDVALAKPSGLFKNMHGDARFYFVHSYHPSIGNAEDALLTADYGYSFVAAIERENIMGVQFHPEKSHKFGMKLLENFVNNY